MCTMLDVYTSDLKTRTNSSASDVCVPVSTGVLEFPDQVWIRLCLRLCNTAIDVLAEVGYDVGVIGLRCR